MAAALVVIAAAALMVYVIAGYPLLLFLGRRRPPRPVGKDMGFQATVSTIVAVHNGEKFIRRKLESLLSLRYPARLLEIIVVSDGSTDRTEEIAREFAGRNVQLICAARRGKAAAINEAMRRASGEILFFTDVRQPLDPDALAHLVANFADPSVGAVSGELRFLDPARAGQQADLELYWRYELWVRRRHSQIDSMISTTGCIYAARRSIAAPIPPDTINDDAVIPLRAFFGGYRVVFDEQAVAYDYPTVEGGEFRRRLRTLAGVWQYHVRLPALFTRANRMRFHFLSHKFARLVLPWAAMSGGFATLALPPSGIRTMLLAGGLVFLSVAWLDSMIPRHWRLRRISSPPRTFVAMNVAALLALSVFVVRPEKLWRPTEVRVGR